MDSIDELRGGKEMAFELPDYSSLNHEQRDVINLPTNINFFIKGSPGTGKTVIAIYRAAQMRNKKVLLLVYNRPLMLYLQSAINTLNITNCEVKTYHAWLSSFYRIQRRTSVPNFGQFQYDWKQILLDFKNIGTVYDHVIIDEAQDFPEELLQALPEVSKNITCFIDSNQAIEPNKTPVIKAIKSLCMESPYTLQYNYRNTKEIAAVAKLYWSGDGHFAKPDVSHSGNKPTLIKCDNFNNLDNEICKIITSNMDKTIGIFTNPQSLNKFYNNLSSLLNKKVNVELYKTGGNNSNINFDTNGVKILSYSTMKGLEFDIVILAAFDKVRSTGDTKADQNRAYVAISRAKEDLYIYYFSEQNNGTKWINTMAAINNNINLFR